MVADEIYKIVQKHNRWRLEQCINLILSENVTSPKTREILASDLGHRYTLKKGECIPLRSP